MRSGVVVLTVANGTFNYAGHDADDWSSRAAYTARAYEVYISTTINPSAEGGRYAGYPLRCLSTVLDM